jgi:hypothetical protein
MFKNSVKSCHSEYFHSALHISFGSDSLLIPPLFGALQPNGGGQVVAFLPPPLGGGQVGVCSVFSSRTGGLAGGKALSSTSRLEKLEKFKPKENPTNTGRLLTILVHDFIGWALCGATMGVGMATTSLQNALIAHATGAPIIFAIVSLVYFKRFNYTTPLQTALIFVAFVIAMDFLVVALLINRSLDMFASLLGTWIPFALIFASTYLTGLYLERSTGQSAVAQ